jgi:YD repeat-containing protein
MIRPVGQTSTVLAGTGASQRLIGYVDSMRGVFDLHRQYLGSSSGIEHGGEHRIRSVRDGGIVVGFVGAKPTTVQGRPWHQVYDAAHQLVGLVDNEGQMASPSGDQLGLMVFHASGIRHRWRATASALRLLF